MSGDPTDGDDSTTSEVKTYVQGVEAAAAVVAGAYSGVTWVIAAAELLGMLDSAPDGTAAALAQIEHQLQQIQDLLLTLGVIDSQHWIDSYLGKVAAAVVLMRQQVFDLQRSGGSLPLPDFGTSSAYQDSLNGAMALAVGASYWQRPYDPRILDHEWARYVAPAPPDAAGRAYEWRLALPALMYAVSARISVAAAFHPDFIQTGILNGELEAYRIALESAFQTISSSVHCARNDRYDVYVYDDFTGTPGMSSDVYCVETNSGTYRHRWVSERDVFPVKPPSTYVPEVQDRVYQYFDDTQQTLWSQVWEDTGLFELRRLIDTISTLQRRNADITQGGPTAGKPIFNDDRSMCVDIENGNPANLTPVWLYWCTGGAAQQWHYDRKSGKIRNTAYDKCLVPRSGGLTRGDPVVTFDCEYGSIGEGQDWSYDPISKRFWHRFGRAFDAQWGSRAAYTPLWLWDANASSAQQWNGKIEYTIKPGGGGGLPLLTR